MGKNRVREVIIRESKGAFSLFGKEKISKEDFDFESLSALRQLLSNEKARMLGVIKSEKPKSIYELAKKLGRGFKTVQEDIKLLERFGFVELIEERTKKRIRHRPKVVVEGITIHFKI